MKAIYGSTQLCVIVEDGGTGVLLEPFLGDHSQRFWVDLANPDLLIDPTDDEIEALDL